jgi:predicted enzyme related to lactoylglutathione lyase
MALVSGIGGIFFRAKDPEGLMQWYRDTFDLQMDDGFWAQGAGKTVFQPFPADTTYFRPESQMMIDFRVMEMDALLARLDAVGVPYRDTPDDNGAYGRFVHVDDPEGSPIELWKPLAKDVTL